MGNPGALICCLLLAAGTTRAQKAETHSADRLLPQWLTGIIAVSCFLLLTFIGFLVKKIWCEKQSSRKRSREESEGGSDAVPTENPYDRSLSLRCTDGVQRDREPAQDTYESSLDVLRGGAKREASDSPVYENSLDVLRSRDNRHAYNNLVMAPSEDSVTAM